MRWLRFLFPWWGAPPPAVLPTLGEVCVSDSPAGLVTKDSSVAPDLEDGLVIGLYVKDSPTGVCQ